jgi:hypothetical protein
VPALAFLLYFNQLSMDLSTEGAGSPKTIDTLNESLTGPAITSDDASHKIDPGVAHAPFKLWNPPTEARPTGECVLVVIGGCD